MFVMNEYKVNSLLVLRNRKIEYNYFIGCCITEYDINTKSLIVIILIEKISDDKFNQTWKCFYDGHFTNVIFNENFSNSKLYEKNSV